MPEKKIFFVKVTTEWTRIEMKKLADDLKKALGENYVPVVMNDKIEFFSKDDLQKLIDNIVSEGKKEVKMEYISYPKFHPLDMKTSED